MSVAVPWIAVPRTVKITSLIRMNSNAAVRNGASRIADGGKEIPWVAEEIGAQSGINAELPGWSLALCVFLRFRGHSADVRFC